jgi:hypothetical protein
LIDWIEYYRIVGPISTFVIYDDKSTDNVTLLQGFYRERGVNVTVIDAPSQKHEGVDGQTRSFAHCLQHVPSDWTLVVDTDEFIWAPNHCTIASWLSVQDESAKMHEVRDLRFGSSQQHERFGYRLIQDENDQVILKNDFGPQVQLHSHTNRGPSPYGPESEIARYNNRHKEWDGCKPPFDWDICSQNLEFGKTIYKWGSCIKEGLPESPHKCYDDEDDPRGKDGSVVVHNQSELRCNHFYIRSKDDAKMKSEQWEKSDPIEMYTKADAYWNSVADTTLKDLIGGQLRKRMEALLGGRSEGNLNLRQDKLSADLNQAHPTPGCAIMVLCTAEDTEMRQLHRETWISDAVKFTSTLQVLFVIGKFSPEQSKAVALENATHGDIVELTMVENMDQGKTHAAYIWAYHHLPEVEYFFKCDLDTMPNWEAITTFLPLQPSPARGLYFGKSRCEAEEYNDELGCALGQFYMLSSSLVRWVAVNESLCNIEGVVGCPEGSGSELVIHGNTQEIPFEDLVSDPV